MSSVVPYLIRAYYGWIEDSKLTPHVLVNTEINGVLVPKGLVADGKIVLNIGSSATSGLLLTNKTISFKARFSGRSEKISVPCSAVLSIYAKENGEGMFFDNQPGQSDKKEKKPNLTILD